MSRHSTLGRCSARIAILATGMIVLAGCNLPARIAPASATTKAQAAQSLETQRLLDYVLQARLLAPAELGAEKERARNEFNVDQSNPKRIKLAILLAMPTSTLPPATAVAEDNELQALVEPLTYSASAARASADPGLSAIAGLLLATAQERRKMREQVRDATLRAQASRREEVHAQAEARILRTQVEDLEKKLNALKAIERSVSSRPGEGGVK